MKYLMAVSHLTHYIRAQEFPSYNYAAGNSRIQRNFKLFSFLVLLSKKLMCKIFVIYGKLI
jgi:hypothetical protein